MANEFWEKAEKLVNGVEEVFQRQIEVKERQLRNQARGFNDETLIRAVNCAKTDVARRIAREEAERRGLL